MSAATFALHTTSAVSSWLGVKLFTSSTPTDLQAMAIATARIYARGVVTCGADAFLATHPYLIGFSLSGPAFFTAAAFF